MMIAKKYSLVYMGTPGFAVEPLRALYNAGHKITAVFTQPDRPAGRGKLMRPPEVKVAALELGLPVFQPATLRSEQVLKMLAVLQPEVIVVAAYAQLLPLEILKLPRYGCKNIHASLLPKYRGGAPIQWAIARGEHQTGISIMQMDVGLDTGDVIMQQPLIIDANETSGRLTERLSVLGAGMIVECLALDDLGESMRKAQNHRESTFARNLRKSDGLLFWNRSAQQIHNSIRAFNPWPGAYSFLGNLRINIQRSSLQKQSITLAPGHITLLGEKLLVGTADNPIEIVELTPAGKRSMDGQAFAKGYLSRLSPQDHRFSQE
jgi:methionyl-tRNA formyltransferase